jgi:hypothetical protein
VFEKEYIIKNADQKLAVRVFAFEFSALQSDATIGSDGFVHISSYMSESKESMLHIRNACTTKIKCLAEVAGSCPLRGTPDITQNLRITFRNDCSQDSASNIATDANLLKEKEIIYLNKVRIIEIEANEEIEIPIGKWLRGQKYRIHLKWQ